MPLVELAEKAKLTSVSKVASRQPSSGSSKRSQRQKSHEWNRSAVWNFEPHCWFQQQLASSGNAEAAQLTWWATNQVRHCVFTRQPNITNQSQIDYGDQSEALIIPKQLFSITPLRLAPTPLELLYYSSSMSQRSKLQVKWGSKNRIFSELQAYLYSLTEKGDPRSWLRICQRGNYSRD